MSRRLASPDAETRSYWPPPPPPPPCIRLNISFDEPASLRVILQLVCFSNFVAKLLSEYAGHSTRLSAPSPLPIDVGRPELFETPTAGATSAPTRATSAT